MRWLEVFGVAMGGVAPMDPEQLSLQRFLGKVTEVGDLVLVANRVDQSTREKITGVVNDLRTILSSDTTELENIERWDSMLARCTAELGGSDQTDLDPNSAEQLYRCLIDLRSDVEAST